MNPGSVLFELKDWTTGYKELLDKISKLTVILNYSQICYSIHDIQVERYNIKIRFTNKIDSEFISELAENKMEFTVTTDNDHIKDWDNSTTTRTYQTVII